MQVVEYEFRSIVRVGPAYAGAGYYRPDGNEGLYTVVGRIKDTADYCLVRGIVPDATKSMWDLICNSSRLSMV